MIINSSSSCSAHPTLLYVNQIWWYQGSSTRRNNRFDWFDDHRAMHDYIKDFCCSTYMDHVHYSSVSMWLNHFSSFTALTPPPSQYVLTNLCPNFQRAHLEGWRGIRNHLVDRREEVHRGWSERKILDISQRQVILTFLSWISMQWKVCGDVHCLSDKNTLIYHWDRWFGLVWLKTRFNNL